jgi:hypothetical protein
LAHPPLRACSDHFYRFVAPDKYKDLSQIRRILINAQERKAATAELCYSSKLCQYVSREATDFVQHCLICNPTYRLGSEGVAEVKTHPWFDGTSRRNALYICSCAVRVTGFTCDYCFASFAGIDWEALSRQSVRAPFLPDCHRANCSVSEVELASLKFAEPAAQLAAADQAKFASYDYRTDVTDSMAGRPERLPIQQPLYKKPVSNIDIADNSLYDKQSREFHHKTTAVGSAGTLYMVPPGSAGNAVPRTQVSGSYNDLKRPLGVSARSLAYEGGGSVSAAGSLSSVQQSPSQSRSLVVAAKGAGKSRESGFEAMLDTVPASSPNGSMHFVETTLVARLKGASSVPVVAAGSPPGSTVNTEQRDGGMAAVCDEP